MKQIWQKGDYGSKYGLLDWWICASIFGIYHSDVFLAVCCVQKKIIWEKSDVPICFLFYSICFISEYTGTWTWIDSYIKGLGYFSDILRNTDFFDFQGEDVQKELFFTDKKSF